MTTGGLCTCEVQVGSFDAIKCQLVDWMVADAKNSNVHLTGGGLRHRIWNRNKMHFFLREFFILRVPVVARAPENFRTCRNIVVVVVVLLDYDAFPLD
jgi:hypothetical protein